MIAIVTPTCEKLLSMKYAVDDSFKSRVKTSVIAVVSERPEYSEKKHEKTHAAQHVPFER